jgi:hypothetical protein
MGIVTSLLAAIGCTPASKAGAKPTLADYEVVLHTAKALAVDPAVSSNGRYQIVPEQKLVLELTTVRGKSAVAYDTSSRWSIALELPANPDPAKPLEVTLDGVPAIARVAGEDILYLARNAKGRVRLTRTSAPVTGELEVAFEIPERDLIKLGTYAVSGTFKAAAK